MNSFLINQELITECLNHFEQRRTDYRDDLVNILHSRIFDNRHTIHPRRLTEIGEEEIDGLIEFFRSGDTEPPRFRGRNRAKEGLSEKAVLSIGSRFREICLTTLDHRGDDDARQMISTIDTYMLHYIAGYLEGREQYLLDEQERLRRAYMKAYPESK